MSHKFRDANTYQNYSFNEGVVPMFQTQNKESLCILYHSLMTNGQKQKGGDDDSG